MDDSLFSVLVACHSGIESVSTGIVIKLMLSKFHSYHSLYQGVLTTETI